MADNSNEKMTNKLISFDSWPVSAVLDILLLDHTSEKNIIFASDDYRPLREDCDRLSEITVDKLIGEQAIDILPRVEKADDCQESRTKSKAEVFTPTWITNRMNNHCDEVWFGKPDVFNTESDQSWTINSERIVFPENRSWQDYVCSKRLEITCGEAPYIVSRYDTVTGEIIPVSNRVGILDRKFRVIDENVCNSKEWHKWAVLAVQSVYGYEFHGDSLLLARINVLLSYFEHFKYKFKRAPTDLRLKEIANIISWNLWQMDGLTNLIPFSPIPAEDVEQMDLFSECLEKDNSEIGRYCVIFDWIAGTSIQYKDLTNRFERINNEKI